MEDLWKIRKRKGMTVAQLSSKAGIPARLIKEYEAGRKTIPSEYLAKLAKALYVDAMDIKPLSEPIPSPPKPKGKKPPAAPKIEKVAPAPPKKKEKKRPPPAHPARPSQISHLLHLIERLGLEQADLEEQIGHPLEELSRPEASHLLREYQQRFAGEKPPVAKKRRGYLPETVDTFELNYLTRQQEEGALLTFTLFDGKVMTGTIIGFSPYTITIREKESGDEVTIQKLAIAYYRRQG